MRLVSVGIVVLLIGIHGCGKQPSESTASIEDRLPKLKQQVVEQEQESSTLFDQYRPQSKGRIDDFEATAVEILRQLPSVVQVETLVSAAKPAHRIIHLQDWHFVPKPLYAIEMKRIMGRELIENEIDYLHQLHLLEVELVQIEQLAILRCLIQYHGLKKVLSEGFSPNELTSYREKIEGLKAIAKETIPRVNKQLEEARKLIGESQGKQLEHAKSIEASLLNVLDEYRVRLLEMGAAGRLLISGELEEVLPLENQQAMDLANPIWANEVKFDPAEIEARHDAQVKAAMASGEVSVIVLGGAHDLTESIRSLGSGTTEYIRVATKRYHEFAGK